MMCKHVSAETQTCTHTCKQPRTVKSPSAPRRAHVPEPSCSLRAVTLPTPVPASLPPARCVNTHSCVLMVVPEMSTSGSAPPGAPGHGVHPRREALLNRSRIPKSLISSSPGRRCWTGPEAARCVGPPARAGGAPSRPVLSPEDSPCPLRPQGTPWCLARPAAACPTSLTDCEEARPVDLFLGLPDHADVCGDFYTVARTLTNRAKKHP